MKLKTIIMLGVYTAITAAGIGASSAQTVIDYRCKSCGWNLESCIARCDDVDDTEAGQCIGSCVQRYYSCRATFCP